MIRSKCEKHRCGATVCGREAVEITVFQRVNVGKSKVIGVINAGNTYLIADSRKTFQLHLIFLFYPKSQIK